MSQRLIVEVSDKVYSIIERQAAEGNISPAQVASVSLERFYQEQHGTPPKARRRSSNRRSKAELQVAREQFERHFGSVDLGYPTGAGNEEIDADLAREYADMHGKA